MHARIILLALLLELAACATQAPRCHGRLTPINRASSAIAVRS